MCEKVLEPIAWSIAISPDSSQLANVSAFHYEHVMLLMKLSREWTIFSKKVVN